jgi:hypothetical protein
MSTDLREAVRERYAETARRASNGQGAVRSGGAAQGAKACAIRLPRICTALSRQKDSRNWRSKRRLDAATRRRSRT